MCILLYVNPLWCSGIPYIYGQLEGGTSALSIYVLCSMLNLFGVVVFHRTMVNWSRGGFCGVAVFNTFMVNWRGCICPKYMCILLYVKLIQCSGIP